MRRLASGAVLCLSLSGCPVPEVIAPDFAPIGVADLGSATRTDGGSDMGSSTDMGPPAWRSETPMGVTSTLRAISASAGITYAVGSAGTILRRDADGTWKKETAPTVMGLAPELYGVVALPSGDVLAVGGGGVVLRRSNSQWSVETVNGATATLYAVTVLAGSGDVVAVGDKGIVAVYSGGTWKTETTPALDTLSLRGVSSGKVGEAYAVGTYAGVNGTSGVILRRGVGTWTLDPGTIAAADRTAFYAVAAAANVVYVAGAGAKVLRQDAAAGWVAEKTITPVAPDGGMAAMATTFYALTGADDGTLVAAGSNGELQVRSAGTWATDVASAKVDLYGISGTWPRSLWVVGAMGYLGRRF